MYELLAERLVIDDMADISPLDRGVEQEEPAMAKFEAITGKLVERIGFITHDENPYIASSPDGLILNGDKYTEAVEIKCPSTAVYLKTWLENEVPDEYVPQIVQYFIVNDDLEKLYFVSYDNRVTMHPMHIIEIVREQYEKEIKEYKLAQEVMIMNVNNKLAEILEV